MQRVSEENGAFPLKVGSRDAATVLTLEPGSYTLITAATRNETGRVFIDIIIGD